MGARHPFERVLRLLACALLSIVPVVVLGLVMDGTYRTEARHRGLAEGRSEAELVARTAIEPLLVGHDLSSNLTVVRKPGCSARSGERSPIAKCSGCACATLGGHVVFSSDAEGTNSPVDDEAVDASKGTIVARLTTLNADDHSKDPDDPAVVEVYEQLRAGQPEHPVGVLEVYLPYAPIKADIAAGLNGLHHDLIDGLAVLYIVLLAISFATSRGLRRQVKANAFLATHDALTDLPNRMLFQQRAHYVVRGGHRATSGRDHVVDLDRFKDVNDSLGHNGGDQLLIAVGERLSARFDRATRPGLAVTSSLSSGAADGSDGFTWDCVHNLDRGRRRRASVVVGASIGVVVDGETGRPPTAALAGRRRDVRREDRAVGVVYSPIHDRTPPRNLTLLGELRERSTPTSWSCTSNRRSWSATVVEAVESLVRWQHPVPGCGADQFVPVAEETGLIEQLTDLVLASSLEGLNHLPGSRPSLGRRQRVGASSTRVDSPTGSASALRPTLPLRTGSFWRSPRSRCYNPVDAPRARADLNHVGVRVDRRLRKRAHVAGLPADPAGRRAEDRQGLRHRPARRRCRTQ